VILETMNKSDPVQGVANNSSLNANPAIPPEEEAEVKRILSKFSKYKKVRARYDKQWLDYYKMFRGVQWSSSRPKWKNSEIINLIFPTIQAQIPLQTDARPKFSFLPTDPTDMEFAETLDKVAEADWEKYNWMDPLFSVILDGYLYGAGLSEMGYNQKLEFGLGAPVYKDVDPFYCYPDPECQDINDSDSEGFFYVFPEPTDRLKRKYPKRANLIKSDIKDWVKINKTDLKSSDSNYFNSDREMPENTYGAVNDDTSIGRTLVFHYYAKPQDVEETVDQDDQGVKTYKVKKKYPGGRYLCIANGMVLNGIDDPLPFEDGLIPFSKYNNYKLPREFWGISECEQLESPQRVFNKILCFALDSLVYMGNPIWVMDTNSDVDEETLANVPGAVIQKTPGSEVRREPGVALSPTYMQVLDRLYTWFNDNAGNSEFSKGNAPGGVTAASAIEQLISASRTRIRQKQRNLDVYMRTVGRQYANRVFQFYKAPRIYRITNSETGANEFTKFNTAVEPDEQGVDQKVAYIQKYEPINPEDPKSQMIAGEVKKLIMRGELDIRVSTGSDLPFEMADKERKSLALFDRQIIDADEVLQQLNYPNKDKILARMQQIQMQRQQLAAQQGQPAQPQGVAQ